MCYAELDDYFNGSGIRFTQRLLGHMADGKSRVD